jgi:prepilin-type processing-associated H-X9-DG protein
MSWYGATNLIRISMAAMETPATTVLAADTAGSAEFGVGACIPATIGSTIYAANHDVDSGGARYMGPSNTTGSSAMIVERHLETINVLWADGHVKSVKLNALTPLADTGGADAAYTHFTIAADPN